MSAQNVFQFSGIRIDAGNMAAGAILTHQIRGYRVCVIYSNLLEAGISGDLACPIQEGNIHHGIYDDPSGAVFSFFYTFRIPCPDKFSVWIVSSGQNRGCIEAADFGFFGTCEAVISDSAVEPHETGIVVKADEAVKGLIQ